MCTRACRILLSDSPFDGDRVGKKNWSILRISNDVSLEHSRKGWLRFVVNGVKSMETYEAEPEQAIEFEVIDKRRVPHRLQALPQSEWKRNAWDNPERVFRAELIMY